jgi:hypothetical protein
VGTFAGANEAVLIPIFTQQMLETGPAMISMMVVIALIGLIFICLL